MDFEPDMTHQILTGSIHDRRAGTDLQNITDYQS